MFVSFFPRPKLFFWSVLAWTAPFWGMLVPVVPTASDRSVLDPAAREGSLGYGAFTHRSLRALRITAAWNGTVVLIPVI